MSNLPLAIDIANAVSTTNEPLDVEAKADELLKSHPEADASREDIRDALKAERNARRTEDIGGCD